MKQSPYLFLDAGGTLVFPDPERITALAETAGFPIDPEGIYYEHYRIVYEVDWHVLRYGEFPQATQRLDLQGILPEAVRGARGTKRPGPRSQRAS